MREQEVKDLIGEENWEAFDQWMRGNTIGYNSDRSVNYYEVDVTTFLRIQDTKHE